MLEAVRYAASVLVGVGLVGIFLRLGGWRLFADWCLSDYSGVSVLNGMWLTDGDHPVDRGFWLR